MSTPTRLPDKQTPRTLVLTTDKRSYRTKREQERDLALIARYYLQGKTRREIAEDLAAATGGPVFSIETIKKDIYKLQQRWLESSLIDFDQAKAIELRRVDTLIEAAWSGWERSLRPGGKVRTETVEDEYLGTGEDGETEVKSGYTRTFTSREEFARDGNPAFLKEIREAIALRLKILGLADHKIEVENNWKVLAMQIGLQPTQAEEILEAAVQDLLLEAPDP